MRDDPCQVNSSKVSLQLGTATASKHQQQDAQPDGPREPLSDSTWRMDYSSQAYSGPEDNCTDPHETCTETSTLTYVDTHNMDESGENHGLRGLGLVEAVYVKAFVLIDDDDDGDMSLREKTVTAMSVMDGNAAALVGGRLPSTSSSSLFNGEVECPSPEALPLREAQATPTKQSCCFCTIL